MIVSWHLPETNAPQQEEELLNAIQAAANRIVAENHPIVCYQQTKAAIVKQFGTANGVLDGSHKKTADTAVLTVAHLQCPDNPAFCVPPARPATTTGSGIAAIQLQRGTGSMACSVVAGKKSKKAEITLKFLVVEKKKDDDDDDDVAGEQANTTTTTTITPLPTLPTDLDLSLVQSSTIRCPEGQTLRDAQEQQAAAEAAAAAALQTPDANPTDTSNINEQQKDEEEMIVNAETVSGKIDYNKLVDDFGSTLISDQVMQQLHAQTVGAGRVPQLHRFLRRGMFFSHRDLEQLLKLTSPSNNQQAPTPLYLYTGRGPSSESMHLGHLIPFLFTKWLQDAFDAPTVIQMTDDEKFLFKGVYQDDDDNLDHYRRLTMENARDIIACGFDYNKTFLFSDLDYVGTMYPNIVRIWKAVTTNTVNGIFGFDGTSNTGKIAFPAVQAAPSFASSFPVVLDTPDRKTANRLCLIPCAIDQDPYFRMTRDVAHKLCPKQHGLGGKPALIHSKFFPPLQGATGKMSSSDPNSAIFLTDTPEQIAYKIKAHAYSGGQETKQLQQQLGANLEVDVAYQWLRFFLEDDQELAQIGQDYGSGQGRYWSTGKVKARLIAVLQELVAEHQARRATITDDDVRKWMVERSIVVPK